jgi:glyoxylase-like metal-dependent hydrolase (beta-lactamase superfamily II)
LVFVEIADRCWAARSTFLDVNVGLVGGTAGLLLVDTGWSEAAGARVVDQVRALCVGEVVAVFNTHEHFDHTFGNVVVSERYDGPRMVTHDAAAAGLLVSGPALQALARADDTEPRHAAIAATRIVAPSETFSSARVVDLGDRRVELVHPGRGHTAGDAVARVPDADVMFAGDLVEGSLRTGPRAGVPGFGDDCCPLEWPASLDLVLSLLTGTSVVVPGHGAAVDRGFVEEQRGEIGTVAETIRDLASRGVPVDQALASARWPYPVEHLGHAVVRGYQQLPRSRRGLPLV